MNDASESDRGRRPRVDRSGEVHGSGAGAGGGNPGEDHDGDPMAGSGADPLGGPKPLEDAARSPVDKHQGRHG